MLQLFYEKKNKSHSFIGYYSYNSWCELVLNFSVDLTFSPPHSIYNVSSTQHLSQYLEI